MLDIIQEYWKVILIGHYPNGSLGGLALTLILSITGIIVAFPLSILIAVMRLSKIKAISWCMTIVVYVVRGIPLIMQIFWAYYLLPIITGHQLSAFYTLLLTLIFYQAIYLSEIMRAGIIAIPQGQMEASRALGFNYFKTMVRIILPQSIFNVLPSITSQFISVIKETSLGYVLSVQEVTFITGQVNNQMLIYPFQVFFILAILYFLTCLILNFSLNAIEFKIQRKRMIII
ncbi:amino acid ABC transporter permease [Pantoea endophytica]|uniref:amino acid ABC transporter permease n=1 Tax=Pantoea endophytica TaxID=92488 RepID=UPI002413B504|nr:amino acid ABC transporter permease [Pantoea endophytica]